jgi:hypothetical protein
MERLYVYRGVEPQITRLAINDEMELVAADGTVYGRLVALEVDLSLLLARARSPVPARAHDTVVRLSVDEYLSDEQLRQNQDLERGVEETISLLPDPVNETWSVYVTALERPKAVLTPKVRKWIKDAHAAVGVEQTQQAIRGLASSEHHRTNGYVGIEYAIRPKQNETVEGRIAMMAAKAPSVTDRLTPERDVLAKFDPDTQESIYGWVNEIRASLRSPDAKGLKDSADWCWKQLQRMGLRPTFDGTQFVAWEELAVEHQRRST